MNKLCAGRGGISELPHLEMRKNFLNQIIIKTVKDITNKAQRYVKNQGIYL